LGSLGSPGPRRRSQEGPSAGEPLGAATHLRVLHGRGRGNGRGDALALLAVAPSDAIPGNNRRDSDPHLRQFAYDTYPRTSLANLVVVAFVTAFVAACGGNPSSAPASAAPSASAVATATEAPTPLPTPEPTTAPPTIAFVPVADFRTTATAVDATGVASILAGNNKQFNKIEVVDADADGILAALGTTRASAAAHLVIATTAAALDADLAKGGALLGFVSASDVGPSVRAIDWDGKSLFGVDRVKSLTDWPLKAYLAETAATAGFDPTQTWTTAAAGDVMLDLVLRYSTKQAGNHVEARVHVGTRGYALVTLHRAENTDDPARLGEFVTLLERLPIPALLPVHPRLRGRLTAEQMARITALPHVYLLDPCEYVEMLALERDAQMILTDSGGVQKEAYFLGVPCLTLRLETEWEETLAGGWNRVAVSAGRLETFAAVLFYDTPRIVRPCGG